MGSNRQQERGAVGKYTGKITHLKSKFDNVFDIRRRYSHNIHSVRKILCWVFQYNDRGENL